MLNQKRIICFGNPYLGDDGFGSAVYQHLQHLADKHREKHDKKTIEKHHLSQEIYEAGIIGLNSLPLFEACKEIVIVDAIHCVEIPENHRQGELLSWSFPAPFNFSIISSEDTAHQSNRVHDFNLQYLLRILPAVLEQPPEQIHLLAALTTTMGQIGDGLSQPIQEAAEQASQLLWHDFLYASVEPSWTKNCH